MDTNKVIENMDLQVAPVQPPKSNKLFVFGLVVAISLAVLFVFLIVVYIFVPGKEETNNQNIKVNNIPTVNVGLNGSSTASEMTTSDEVVEIDKDLTNTEIPNTESDLLQIEQQIGQ